MVRFADNVAQKLFATGVGVSHVTDDVNVAGEPCTTTCEIGSANQLTNRGVAELLDSRRRKTCIASGSTKSATATRPST
jgi:hypothetical protein